MSMQLEIMMITLESLNRRVDRLTQEGHWYAACALEEALRRIQSGIAYSLHDDVE